MDPLIFIRFDKVHKDHNFKKYSDFKSEGYSNGCGLLWSGKGVELWLFIEGNG